MKNRSILLLLLLGLGLVACETEFTPDDADLDPEIVVEGFIEAGDEALPPFVLLTRSVPFFSSFDPDEFNNLFVHDAEVVVTDDLNTYSLEEFCVEDIPEPLREAVLALLGINIQPDEELPNFCAYVDTTGTLQGQIGKTYDLSIEVEGKMITASTTIPEPVPLFDIYFQKPTEFSPDSLLELRCSIDDPGGRADYYRYLTEINNEGFVAPFQSATDDAFFDGQSFEFVLSKAESRIDPPGIDTFGLFTLGDTARIKWCTIDEAHYRFWSTLEFNAVSQGPFSSYTIVDTNVEGGIGVWGGYAVRIYESIVE
ncbi:MAG: DUF4249 domain-containing protein [Saprospiraceae bacterium]|nr:DUF4249 domain-containing protein [Saprospiraceae bacterium]